jgi:hypothetical protein
MMHTTNYIDTFIAVAEDCPINAAEIPPLKGDNKTIANLQFEKLIEHPYQYTSDDVIFGAYAAKNGITRHEMEEERAKFFSKGQACMRSSPLTKRYGWGVHSNTEGKIALFPMESDEYQQMTGDQSLKQTRGMRSKRA